MAISTVGGLGGLEQSVPSRQSVPLPCHISTDALLRIGMNTAETNIAGYQ
jgi:hypothetical protein